ncbi:MAG: hypothetical protein KAT65_00645 [Methanophagales archaeon]|nr:hypothetical protein [Methanophagales archaeon]
MENEKLIVHETIVKPIAKDIEEVVNIFSEKKDIRLVLRLVINAGNKIKSIPEFEETPENRFATFIVWNIIGQTGSIFQNKTKEWYKVNENTIKEIGEALMNYLRQIRDSLENESYEDMMEASKGYFVTFVKITDKLTISLE